MARRGHRRRRDRPRGRGRRGPRRVVVGQRRSGGTVYNILECGHEMPAASHHIGIPLESIKPRQCSQCRKEANDADV